MFRYALISCLLVVISLGIIGLSRNAIRGSDSLIVLCAPSLSGPMEELRAAFIKSQSDPGESSDTSEVSIDILYRGSAELFALYQMSQRGDVLVAADVDYHRAFVDAKICDEPVTLGQQFPCLIYTKISQRQAVSSLSEEVSPLLSMSIPKPENAAIGRAVSELMGEANYRDLISRAKVSRETVTQVAADVSSGIVDVGIAWTTTRGQFENLKSVVVADWKEHPSRVGASVFIEGRHTVIANRFRDFMQSAAGQKILKKYQFAFAIDTAKVAVATEQR